MSRLVFAALALVIGLAAPTATTSRVTGAGRVPTIMTPKCAAGRVVCGRICISRAQVCRQPRPRRCNACNGRCIPKGQVCHAFFDSGGSPLYVSRVYLAPPPSNSVAPIHKP